MRRVQYFSIMCILSVSLLAQRVECAALTSTAWYSPITKSVGACASSYRTWRMVHPRLATTSDLAMLVGALIWIFNHFDKPASTGRDSEELSFYSDDQKPNEPCLAPDKTRFGTISNEELTRPPSL